MPCKNCFHLKKTNDELTGLKGRSALKADFLNKQCRRRGVNQCIKDLHFQDIFSQELSKANILPISFDSGRVLDGWINKVTAFNKYSDID